MTAWMASNLVPVQAARHDTFPFVRRQAAMLVAAFRLVLLHRHALPPMLNSAITPQTQPFVPKNVIVSRPS